jgi:hypothetical protein
MYNGVSSVFGGFAGYPGQEGDLQSNSTTPGWQEQ